ncbi:hypothetical protein QAD02_010592 [Eretmocerus hayati]|uniref:Uncharacterized protein n=1 Tax=Eretmocerus hayati TaxID=131215 RepID=A0ACC2NVJ0_9HYME|nr:hypothetical protein QAD02_010592 [Eretmocerus hayati]
MKFLLTACLALTLALASQASSPASEDESHGAESYEGSGSYADYTTVSSPEEHIDEEPNSNGELRERRTFFNLFECLAKTVSFFINLIFGGSSSNLSDEQTDKVIKESYEGKEAGFDGYRASPYRASQVDQACILVRQGRYQETNRRRKRILDASCRVAHAFYREARPDPVD